jgi:D-glycero-D-manno-heptose 1,7-bisphosphate phosphatase
MSQPPVGSHEHVVRATPRATTGARPAAFFDRDGVLNHDRGYVHRIEDFLWIDGAREAIALLRAAGYLTVMVTNQSGIARGYYDEAALQRLHAHLQQDLARFGTTLDAWYFCPHLPDAALVEFRVDCPCRKPKPGMLLRAAQEHTIDLPSSLLIGDKQSDLEAANAAGARGFLFRGGDLLAFAKDVLIALNHQPPPP